MSLGPASSSSRRERKASRVQPSSGLVTTIRELGGTALGLLALVAGQDVEQDEDGTWKIVLVWPKIAYLDGRSRGSPHAQVSL